MPAMTPHWIWAHNLTARIEVLTPADNTLQIPADAHTQAGNVQTWRHVDGATDVWAYEASVADVGDLAYYGDGAYTVTVHHADSSQVPYGAVHLERPDPGDAFASIVYKGALAAEADLGVNVEYVFSGWNSERSTRLSTSRARACCACVSP